MKNRNRKVFLMLLAAILVVSLYSVSYANTVDTPAEEEELLEYAYFEGARAGLSISGGIATVTARITPKSTIALSYAVMTVELVKSSSGATVQSWSGTYYPNGVGTIAFEDTQALYATGAYYVRASGTVYATSGSHETFNVSSGTATY